MSPTDGIFLFIHSRILVLRARFDLRLDPMSLLQRMTGVGTGRSSPARVICFWVCVLCSIVKVWPVGISAKDDLQCPARSFR